MVIEPKVRRLMMNMPGVPYPEQETNNTDQADCENNTPSYEAHDLCRYGKAC